MPLKELQKLYCGSKAVKPEGYTRRGTSPECFDKGLKVGYAISKRSESKNIKKAIVSTATDFLKKTKPFKTTIRLSGMTKDGLRDLIIKEGGTKVLPQYYNATKQKLYDRLKELGYQD